MQTTSLILFRNRFGLFFDLNHGPPFEQSQLREKTWKNLFVETMKVSLHWGRFKFLSSLYMLFDAQFDVQTHFSVLETSLGEIVRVFPWVKIVLSVTLLLVNATKQRQCTTRYEQFRADNILENYLTRDTCSQNAISFTTCLCSYRVAKVL